VRIYSVRIPVRALALCSLVPLTALADGRPSAVSPRPLRHVTVAPAESLAVQRPPKDAPADARVVLVTGVLGSAFSMRHVTAALTARGLAVAVIDPLGMGASSRPATADYSLEAQAARVLVVLDSLRWPRVVLAGQGTSATIALRAAARAPHRVAGVVSIAGGPVASQRTDGLGLALRAGPLLNTPPGRALARRHFGRALRARAVRDDWVTPDVERAYVAPLLADLPRALRALEAMGASAEPTALEVILARVTVPVRVLVGRVARPGAPTDAQLALLVRHLRDVRIDSLADSGVLLHEEAPGAVARGIAALVEGGDAPVRDD
jgi:pimeloyl-ACP methyl ester carboxylesterase